MSGVGLTERMLGWMMIAAGVSTAVPSASVFYAMAAATGTRLPWALALITGGVLQVMVAGLPWRVLRLALLAIGTALWSTVMLFFVLNWQYGPYLCIAAVCLGFTITCGRLTWMTPR